MIFIIPFLSSVTLDKLSLSFRISRGSPSNNTWRYGGGMPGCDPSVHRQLPAEPSLAWSSQLGNKAGDIKTFSPFAQRVIIPLRGAVAFKREWKGRGIDGHGSGGGIADSLRPRFT